MITTFGEIMLRIFPKDSASQIVSSLDFEVRPGGSEANVATALSSLGKRAAFVTCLPANTLGDKIIRELKADNVFTDYIIRNSDRLGIYWTETGLGPRNSVVIYDRENSGFSNLDAADFQWLEIFERSEWFHFSGISPAVSEKVYTLLEHITEQCHCPISVDLNYREKLWKWVGNDREMISRIMTKLCRKAKLIAGNETDFQNIFSISSNAKDQDEYYTEIATKCFELFHDCRFIAVSCRNSVSATCNKWSGYLFVHDKQLKIYKGVEYRIDSIADRIGTGDSFTAGIIFGLKGSNKTNYQHIIDFAVTISALNHTVRGDASRFSADEVYHVLKTSGSGRVIR